MTDYVGLDGKARIKVEGTGSAYSEGRAVTQLSTSAVRAVDGKGALNGPAFDALGALHDGLAPARTERNFGYVDGAGKFVIPTDYNAVTPFADQRAGGSTMDLSKIIDPAGNALARVEMVCGMRTLYGSAGETIFLEVAAKKAECSHPMIPNYQCLMVRERRYNEAGVQQPTQDKWHPLYQSIEGFEHKDGVRTVLRVKRYDWKNPPADAPSKVYVLDMVVEQDASKK
ncbi:hypothetical protein G6F31_017142 [Rhizopus arrhizus]|nr:hypothetical protein G6F31_017142 [Rhizopus arrhizus]